MDESWGSRHFAPKEMLQMQGVDARHAAGIGREHTFGRATLFETPNFQPHPNIDLIDFYAPNRHSC